ncbi:MAG: putative cysteine desulfurase, partial [candidate division WS6 bacterium OLB20]
MNKSDFPLLQRNPELVYLDSAATSQKPQVVIDRVSRYYEEENANIHRGIYKLAETATAQYEEAREILATFAGTTPDRTIFTPGATHSLNYVALGLLHKLLKPGTKNTVLTSVMEHHANLIPWQQHAVRLGMHLEYVEIDGDYQLDLQEIEKKLKNGDVRVLALTHMSNVLGTITPLAGITAMVRKFSPDTVIVVDGSQYAPHYPLDLSTLDVDFYALAGHKMLGPTGIGVLYGKQEYLQLMDPPLTGGGMISKVERQKTNWAELPAKLEPGTPNIAGAIGLAEAARYLQKTGFDRIVKHEQELTEYMLAKLSDVPGLTVFGPADPSKRGGVVSFAVKGIHPHDVAQLLDEHNIAVRAGHHCNQVLMREVLKVSATTRASLYLYNTYEDVDAFDVALRKVVRTFFLIYFQLHVSITLSFDRKE